MTQTIVIVGLAFVAFLAAALWFNGLIDRALDAWRAMDNMFPED